MRKSVSVLALSALVGALFGIAGPAQASSRGSITISPSNPLVEKSYPGISAAKPGTPTTPFAQVRNCEDGKSNSTYCDNVDLKVEVPANYKPIYKVRITLTWDPGPTNNDLSLWIWDFKGYLGQTEYDPVGPAVASDTAAGKKPPRVAELGEPPTKTFYISIVNYGPSINSGYKLRVEWILVNLGPDYAGPPGDDDPIPAYKPTPESAKTRVNPALTAPFKEEVETITVKVPGPDGELIDVEIPLVKAAGVARTGETASNPVVPIILGLLGLGLVLFLYFFVWRRRRGEETA